MRPWPGELTISLSAFLRTSVTAAHTSGGEISFGEFPVADSRACFGMALVRPDDRKLILVVEYSVLLPLVGIALGAKAGSFGAVDRKPTEIELQVVGLLYRMILSDAYRSWATLMKTPLETVIAGVRARSVAHSSGHRSGVCGPLRSDRGRPGGTAHLAGAARFVRHGGGGRGTRSRREAGNRAYP